MKEILKNEKTPAEKLKRGSSKRRLGILRSKKIASLIKKGSVLDVGCAIGNFTNYIKNKKVHYFGIDNSKDRIKVAKQKESKNIKFMVGNGLKIPFKKSTFDYVVIGELIEHVENPFDLLKECKRVLKKGGLLIGSTPNPSEFQRTIHAILRKDFGSSQHFYIFGPFELKTMLKHAGFKKIKIDFDAFKFFQGVYGRPNKLFSALFPWLSVSIIFNAQK